MRVAEAQAKKYRSRLGLTLVELLVVLTVSIIVAAVAVSLYLINGNYYLQSEDEILLQQNLRGAMYTLTRDLRMAGVGMFILGPGVSRVQAYVPFKPSRVCGQPFVADKIDWFYNCDSSSLKGARAIFGEDGGRENSDIVTVFLSEPEFSGQVGEVAALSGNELSLVSGVDERAIFPGDILAAVKGESTVIFETLDLQKSAGQIQKIELKLKGRFTSPEGVPAGFPIVGALLYNLKNVTLVSYYVDEAKNQLMAVYHDQKAMANGEEVSLPIPVADHIEDLQVYYYFGSEKVDYVRLTQDPAIGEAKLSQSAVRAVTVGLTGKSLRKVNRISQSRPALFNRAAGSKKDNYNRGSLVSTINLRNYD
ncbi:MAG: hypothetical protein LBR11_11740 [Deltaproteobacteria bacterium]|jgi:hypothetical protein|nr:hypothetical protein [Deltaproteobacteria bacterium]